MTNLEYDKLALIERGMYQVVHKQTVANIIDINQLRHNFTVIWTIIYDLPKPLWPKEIQASHPHAHTVEHTSEPLL